VLRVVLVRLALSHEAGRGGKPPCAMKPHPACQNDGAGLVLLPSLRNSLSGTAAAAHQQHSAQDQVVSEHVRSRTRCY
jgi:hypothetical protein